MRSLYCRFLQYFMNMCWAVCAYSHAVIVWLTLASNKINNDVMITSGFKWFLRCESWLQAAIL